MINVLFKYNKLFSILILKDGNKTDFLIVGNSRNSHNNFSVHKSLLHITVE